MIPLQVGMRLRAKYIKKRKRKKIKKGKKSKKINK
jgi:hypothetical protein